MRLQYIYSTLLTREEPGNKASRGGGRTRSRAAIIADGEQARLVFPFVNE